MITRRTVLGVGMTIVSSAFASSFKPYAATPGNHMRPVDAMLVDKNVQLPRAIAAYIDTRRQMLPVIPIDLDAANYSSLMELLRKSHAIAGISSGATLFCLERLAWNHDYRLTGRTQHCVSDQTCHQDMAGFLRTAHSLDARPSSGPTSYRPSHSDDTLHGWVMRKQHRQTSRVV